MGKSTTPVAVAARPARRRRSLLLRGTVLVLAALAAIYWLWVHQDARLATAQTARLACSCHYIAGRGLDDCRGDVSPDMDLVVLSLDEQERSVTAWLPLFGSETARYAEGPGCALDSWSD